MNIAIVKKTIVGSLAIGLFGLATSAQALMLSITPASQIGMPGDTVSVDVLASDLGGAFIGDFDLDIGFDSTALSYVGYTLGGGLGDAILGESVDFNVGNFAPGLVGVSELSLLESDLATCITCLAPYLEDLQDGISLVLATIDFEIDVLPEGSFTDVFFSTVYALGDGAGDPLTATTQSGRITNPSTQVPLPATAFLMLAGLLAMGSQRRR